mmetsp:Transcript_77805/g.152698  ORF Transcript_77805/g.152698 Transcript_77805/m.152698 type:complete len:267 (+) Transcript_77805:106-906(+)
MDVHLWDLKKVSVLRSGPSHRRQKSALLQPLLRGILQHHPARRGCRSVLSVSPGLLASRANGRCTWAQLATWSFLMRFCSKGSRQRRPRHGHLCPFRLPPQPYLPLAFRPKLQPVRRRRRWERHLQPMLPPHCCERRRPRLPTAEAQRRVRWNPPPTKFDGMAQVCSGWTLRQNRPWRGLSRKHSLRSYPAAGRSTKTLKVALIFSTRRLTKAFGSTQWMLCTETSWTSCAGSAWMFPRKPPIVEPSALTESRNVCKKCTNWPRRA